MHGRRPRLKVGGRDLATKGAGCRRRRRGRRPGWRRRGVGGTRFRRLHSDDSADRRNRSSERIWLVCSHFRRFRRFRRSIFLKASREKRRSGLGSDRGRCLVLVGEKRSRRIDRRNRRIVGNPLIRPQNFRRLVPTIGFDDRRRGIALQRRGIILLDAETDWGLPATDSIGASGALDAEDALLAVLPSVAAGRELEPEAPAIERRFEPPQAARQPTGLRRPMVRQPLGRPPRFGDAAFRLSGECVK